MQDRINHKDNGDSGSLCQEFLELQKNNINSTILIFFV